MVTYSVADPDAGYVAAVSYSGEAAPASFVPQEQVFMHFLNLNVDLPNPICSICSSDPGEAGRRSPEARQNLRQVCPKILNFYTTALYHQEGWLQSIQFNVFVKA